MTNKLKPEDVMKALDCCIEDGYFQECFLKDFERISVEDILKAALALLHEKDARIEHLEKAMSESILWHTGLLENLNKLVEKKDAELERLTKQRSISEEA